MKPNWAVLTDTGQKVMSIDKIYITNIILILIIIVSVVIIFLKKQIEIM